MATIRAFDPLALPSDDEAVAQKGDCLTAHLQGAVDTLSERLQSLESVH